MVIVVGKHSALFIPEREMIISLEGSKFINIQICDIISQVVPLKFPSSNTLNI